MEFTKPTKRPVAVIFPIAIDGDVLSIYLQKRSADAVWLPNKFGFWGGGIEPGESPQEGLLRELKEEMGIDFNVNEAELFNHYEFLNAEMYGYITRVSKGWEKQVIVGEGEYGQWFTAEEAYNEPQMILSDKSIINDLERKLLNKPIR